MKKIYTDSVKVMFSIVISITLLTTIGCVSTPKKNPVFERARAAYSQAKAKPEITNNAPVTMHEAGQTLKKAEQAKDVGEMEHLAYLAERQVQLAIVLSEQKMAENERERLSKERNRILLEAREREVTQARGEAEAKAIETEKVRKEAQTKALELEKAKGEAEALARQVEQVRKEAEAKAREVERAKNEAQTKTIEIERVKEETEAKALELGKAKKEAEAIALQVEQIKKEAEVKELEIEQVRKAAEARTLELELAKKDLEAKAKEIDQARLEAEQAMAERAQLEKELAELKAKQTDRGIVLTLEDILFETDKDILMPGAMRTIDKITEFLNKYSKRDILIEGHTDSVGSETYNLGLSQRRADAMRTALISNGIQEERVTTKGYGEKYPVATNSTPTGRQQNRRVEIIILDEGVKGQKMFR